MDIQELNETQNKQLKYLEAYGAKNHQLVCNDCQVRITPRSFGACLVFYEAHRNHSTFIVRIW